MMRKRGEFINPQNASEAHARAVDSLESGNTNQSVLRMPSLKGEYSTGGWTALIDASIKALDDLSKTPELSGDHAFLMYVLTDGAENRSKNSSQALAGKIQSLKDNWTVAVFVPDQNGKFEAKKFGFPADNIATWDTTAKGLSEAGETIKATTETFMTARSAGIRGYKNLFNLAPVTKQAVTQSLTKLHFGQFRMHEVKEKTAIAPFVEKLTNRPYKLGEGFYQLTKPDKSVCLFDKKSKSLYTGKEARTLLKLPDYEVKVSPVNHPDYEIFVQSMSVNRNLMPGSSLLLLS